MIRQFFYIAALMLILLAVLFLAPHGLVISDLSNLHVRPIGEAARMRTRTLSLKTD